MTKLNPHLVRVGTDAHYEDADYYDKAYERRREDVMFYAEFAAKSAKSVLELGVGTGRVAIETARRGVEIVGIDRMPSMLARAKKLLAEEPAVVRSRVTLKRGDLLKVRLDRKFSLVTSPFNVFQHLYTRDDFERALGTVKAHLAPRGTFVFDVLMPDAGSLARDPNRFYKSPAVKHPDGKRYSYAESFDYDAVNQVQTVTMAFSEQNDVGNTFVQPLLHRQFFPQELEALLHYNGFELRELYGDFDRSPLSAASESQICVCVRRR